MFFKLIKAPLLSAGVYCCVISKNCTKKLWNELTFFPDDHVSRDNTDPLTISLGLRAGLQQGWFQHMAWEPGWKRLLRFSNDQRAKLGDCFRNFGLGKGFFSSSNIKPYFWKFIDLRMLTIWEPLCSHLYFITPTLWRVSLKRAQGFCLGKLLKI